MAFDFSFSKMGKVKAGVNNGSGIGLPVVFSFFFFFRRSKTSNAFIFRKDTIKLSPWDGDPPSLFYLTLFLVRVVTSSSHLHFPSSSGRCGGLGRGVGEEGLSMVFSVWIV